MSGQIITPDALIARLNEVRTRYPYAVLQRNDVGNLLIFNGWTYIGWIDLAADDDVNWTEPQSVT